MSCVCVCVCVGGGGGRHVLPKCLDFVCNDTAPTPSCMSKVTMFHNLVYTRKMVYISSDS